MPVDANPCHFRSTLKPWWLRAQSGDSEAYHPALAVLASRLRGYLKRRLCGRSNMVENLVQETLLALHLQRGMRDPSLPVSAWAARHPSHPSSPSCLAAPRQQPLCFNVAVAVRW